MILLTMQVFQKWLIQVKDYLCRFLAHAEYFLQQHSWQWIINAILPMYTHASFVCIHADLVCAHARQRVPAFQGDHQTVQEGIWMHISLEVCCVSKVHGISHWDVNLIYFLGSQANMRFLSRWFVLYTFMFNRTRSRKSGAGGKGLTCVSERKKGMVNYLHYSCLLVEFHHGMLSLLKWSSVFTLTNIIKNKCFVLYGSDWTLFLCTDEHNIMKMNIMKWFIMSVCSSTNLFIPVLFLLEYIIPGATRWMGRVSCWW